MRSNLHRNGTDADRGAYAVMYAVLSTVLIGAVSVVIDLAALRLDRRVDRAAADAAAIAGAGQLGEFGENPRGACERAMSYVAANLGTTSAGGACAGFPAAVSCDPAPPTQDSVEETIAGRTVRVTWPVPDGDPLLEVPDIENVDGIGITIDETEADGEPCQRLGVQISHDRAFLFAGIFDKSGATTRSRSVGLTEQFSTGDLPVPLVTLDETACPALVLGDGDLEVDEGSTSGFPGEITIDSDCDGAPAIDVEMGRLAATRIGVFLLEPGVTYPRVDGDLMFRGWRVTDRPWQDRYDCQRTATACGLPLNGGDNDYLSQWTEYAGDFGRSVVGMPDPPPIPPGTLELSGSACSIMAEGTFSVPVHARCDDPATEDVTERLRIAAEVTFEQELITDEGVVVTPAGRVEFLDEVHIGDSNSDDLTVEGAATADFRDDLVVEGRLSVDGAATVGIDGPSIVNRLRVQDDALLTGNATVTARAGLEVRDSAELSVHGSLRLRGTATVGERADVRVDGELTLDRSGAGSSGTLRVLDSADLTVDGLLWTDNSLLINGNGTPTGGWATVTLGDRVIIGGNASLTGTACLLIGATKPTDCDSHPSPVNPASPGDDAASIFVGRDLSASGPSSLVLRKVFAYVGDDLSIASSGVVSLVGPYGNNGCIAAGTVAWPSPGCFEDLALWVDGDDEHVLRLRNDDAIDGTVVAPGEDGALELQWDDDVTLSHAQFVAGRLIFDGSGPNTQLTIRPDPERTTLIPQSAGTLIR